MLLMEPDTADTGHRPASRPANRTATGHRERMAELLLAIGQHRDEQAFAGFYDYFAGRVKSFLIGKGMNEQVAEELMQEIMLTVWRRADSYDPDKAAPSTWLFTIARNRRIDYLRGNARIEVELDDELLEADVEEDDSQERHVSRLEAARTVDEAMARLPAEQQQVLHLSYFRGQSHGAIARWLDLPVGTVKSRIRLGMQAIRQQLVENDESGV